VLQIPTRWRGREKPSSSKERTRDAGFIPDRIIQALAGTIRVDLISGDQSLSSLSGILAAIKNPIHHRRAVRVEQVVNGIRETLRQEPVESVNLAM